MNPLDEEIRLATERLNAARYRLAMADLEVFRAETILKQEEALGRVCGLDGKNADEREANLHLKLAREIEALNVAKVDRIRAAGEYDISLADVRCVRARIALEAGVLIP